MNCTRCGRTLLSHSSPCTSGDHKHELEIEGLKRRPGPQATTWREDYDLSRFWLARALEVWAAIPNEFRGPATLEAGAPRTLVQKVESMAHEIERLRRDPK